MNAALALDSNQWFAYWIIADADLRQQDFEGANKEAQLAVKVGKGAGNGAQLIQGEALASLGRNAEAIQALESFVRQEPKNSSVPKAQSMIATLKAGGSSASQSAPNPSPTSTP